MNRFYATLLFFLFAAALGYSQGVKTKQSKFYNITEAGYGHGIGNINFKALNRKVKNEGYHIRLRTQFGYFLSDQFSLGIGFGLDGYHNYTFNTAPLFIDGRYYFKAQPQTYFVFANLGYAIPLSEIFEQGVMGGISIGRKISARRLILLPSIGFNVQQIESAYDTYNQSTITSNAINLLSIQLNLGLMF